jgi:hypothetical protein
LPLVWLRGPIGLNAASAAAAFFRQCDTILHQARHAQPHLVMWMHRKQCGHTQPRAPAMMPTNLYASDNVKPCPQGEHYEEGATPWAGGRLLHIGLEAEPRLLLPSPHLKLW